MELISEALKAVVLGIPGFFNNRPAIRAEPSFFDIVFSILTDIAEDYPTELPASLASSSPQVVALLVILLDGVPQVVAPQTNLLEEAEVALLRTAETLRTDEIVGVPLEVEHCRADSHSARQKLPCSVPDFVLGDAVGRAAPAHIPTAGAVASAVQRLVGALVVRLLCVCVCVSVDRNRSDSRRGSSSCGLGGLLQKKTNTHDQQRHQTKQKEDKKSANRFSGRLSDGGRLHRLSGGLLQHTSISNST